MTRGAAHPNSAPYDAGVDWEGPQPVPRLRSAPTVPGVGAGGREGWDSGRGGGGMAFSAPDGPGPSPDGAGTGARVASPGRPVTVSTLARSAGPRPNRSARGRQDAARHLARPLAGAVAAPVTVLSCLGRGGGTPADSGGDGGRVHPTSGRVLRPSPAREGGTGRVPPLVPSRRPSPRTTATLYFGGHNHSPIVPSPLPDPECEEPDPPTFRSVP